MCGTPHTFIPTPRLQQLGDYAGFMAMDTTMTSNWHQPVQSIGSSKGDGIIFKHAALVVFHAGSTSLTIDPARDYTVHRASADPDHPDAEYPSSKFPLRMAMLVAQHSASIPDKYSITYTPSSKWDQRAFGALAVLLPGQGRGAHALVALAMGSAKGCLGKGGSKKRKLEDNNDEIIMVTSPTASLVLATVPAWVMQGFNTLVQRYSKGVDSFSPSNFSQAPSNLDDRGVPEIAIDQKFEGTSFSLKKVPCIVNAAFYGTLKVHSSNSSFMWVAKDKKHKKEKLVFLKCWDPDCRRASKERGGNPVFDRFGWALLDKPNLAVILG